jgi:hypothetical protein
VGVNVAVKVGVRVKVAVAVGVRVTVGVKVNVGVGVSVANHALRDCCNWHAETVRSNKAASTMIGSFFMIEFFL